MLRLVSTQYGLCRGGEHRFIIALHCGGSPRNIARDAYPGSGCRLRLAACNEALQTVHQSICCPRSLIWGSLKGRGYLLPRSRWQYNAVAPAACWGVGVYASSCMQMQGIDTVPLLSGNKLMQCVKCVWDRCL